MGYTLGIDIGTFETKGVIVDGDGRIVASAARPHRMIVPRPGWAEHRPRQDWWGDFVHCTRAMLASSGLDPRAITCVAPSAIGPCMLPVDERGEALCNAALYGVDARAAVEIGELTASLGGARVLAACGNALTTQSVGPKILWLKKNRPEIYDRASRFVTSTTYIVQKLTGECVIDHYSAAGFSPLYVVGKGWSDELNPGIVETARLPRLAWSTEIAGTLSAAAARQTGLARGTPVIAGTIDAASEAISVGVRRPGDMMVMYGSTIFTIMLSQRRIEDARLWYAPWLFPGEHASMAGLATSGTLTHWFRDRFAAELDAGSAFAALAAEAEASPAGARGIVMLPYFSGERTPIHDPHAKGMIFGLNLTHTRGDIYRALLEGIANGTAHIIETYREIGEPPVRLLAVGGGTRNKVWSQATSDIARAPQIVAERTVGASYGNAFLAAVATGAASRGDIAGWNPIARRITPSRRNRDVYERQYAVFKSLYANTRTLMADLG